MVTSTRTRRLKSLILGVLPAVFLLSACSTRHGSPVVTAAACTDLAQKVSQQETDFVNRVRDIRGQHLLLLEYDQRMIDAITSRRDALQATELTEMSVTEEVSGCSGSQLEDLRRRAQHEMTDLRVFLNTFKRALKSDPEGIYIDQTVSAGSGSSSN